MPLLVRALNALTLLFVLVLPAAAAVPTFLPTQGVLRDNTGTPVYEGTYSVLFSLYDAPDAAEALWTEAWPPVNVNCGSEPQMCVQVTQGVFYVELGSHLPLTPTVFASGAKWMGISVEGEPELPRTRLGTLAYAFVAASAEYAVDAGQLMGQSATDFEPAGAAQEAVAQHELASPHLTAAEVEPAGAAAAAVTAHEGSSPHLTVAQHQALTGGPDSVADDHHTHGVQGENGEPAPASADVQTFTSSGTWTKPTLGTLVMVACWGAGASGGASNSNNGGGGGGGGAYVKAWFGMGDLGATETVTIGAGGASVSAQNPGNSGGNTTFGSILTAYGGGGGSGTDSGGGGGGGGALGAGATVLGNGGAAGGDPGGGASTSGGGPNNSPGESADGFGGGAGGPGGDGDGGKSAYGGGGGGAGGNFAGTGGDSLFGGGGGGGADNDTAVAGGTSVFGGNGGAGGNDGAGAAGTQPGGAGGGGGAGQSSGAGADGQCIVRAW